MKQEELIAQLHDETKKLIKVIESFYEFDVNQLNYQKSDTSWNILQCIEHLNRYSKFYLNEFNKRIIKGNELENTISFNNGFLGKLFTKGMLPDQNMKKMKTFKSKNPQKIGLNIEVLHQFIEDQNKFLNLLEKAKKVDLNKNNCQITLPLIRMRLGDTLTFYVYHNIRHVTQAKNIVF